MKKTAPKYRKQTRSTGKALAFVDLNGQRLYLGPYDSPASYEKYHSLLAEWNAAGRLCPVSKEECLTVMELLARFWQHATQYYRKPDGTATSELGVFKQVIKPVKKLYATLSVSEFTALKLQAIRTHMVQMGWARTNINKSVIRIRHIFRWGVSQELVPPEIVQSLASVLGLKQGRCDAKESAPVMPVPQGDIEAIKPFVSRQVWGLIQLQLCTAARAGELVHLRLLDLDTTEAVWIYTPPDHKTAHKGHRRTIYLGPKAQGILKEFMADRPVSGYLFSPRQAEKERHAKASSHRRSDQKSNIRKTQRVLGEYYTQSGYRQAIHRACDKAEILRWSPHRLRHNAATYIRKTYGLEAAQVMLGHRKADVTQLYAEINQTKGKEIATMIG